ncbi:Crp/Fnr family transcriptional regulator [bacterium]|nr:Crp/Fnr family transcriptional regulator [bacterium]
MNLNKNEIVIEKGEIIYQEGEKINHLVYLKEGLVKLYKTGPGRSQQIISIATPRDFIGLLSVFSNTEYLYSLAALEDSSLCMIDLDVIKKIILQNGKFALNLIEKMNRISDVVLSNKVELGIKQLRGRIAHILLMFADQIYRSDIYELPVSRKEVGELIDMRTENVVRILSEFRKDQLIGIEGKKIEIKNKSMLKKISELG